MRNVVVGVFAFVAMEPVTYAVHRWVMHGFGMGWHRSHHLPRRRALEANDRFPVVFAAIVGALLAVGFNVDGASALVPIGVGITGYGVAYAIVHDGYIHRRLPLFGRRHDRLDALAEAHTLHHRFGREPYGMLLPIVPASIRRRLNDPAEPSTASGVR